MDWLIDTNVLLRLAEPEQTQCQEALAALQMLHDSDHRLCIVPQNLYEYWVVATRPRETNGMGLPLDQACNDLSDLCEMFVFLRDERTVFSRWQQLVAEVGVIGKRSHDARLVASMHRHKLTHLLTFNDADFKRFPDITVMTPVESLLV